MAPFNDTYALGRDFKSASRLNYQHYLWYETLQFHLHPAISATLPSTASDHRAPRASSLSISSPAYQPRIADVGCGTAAWLRSITSIYPHALLDGFDVSLAQCTHPNWLPANLRLYEWNVFDEPRDDIVGVYDIVHVRLLFTVVRDNDPAPIVENLIKLLKPGGWLQWDDLDVAQSYILHAELGVEAPTMATMLKTLQQMGQWVGDLADVMKQSGLQEAKIWRYEEREDLVKAFFDNNLAKDEEMAENALRDTEDGRKLLNCVLKMYEESVAGVVICTPKIVCTAKKL